MEKTEINFNGKKVMMHLRDEADRSVMREIFKFREYRAAEEVVKGSKEPILDVGAHAGFFTLYARYFNPKAKILALEPSPGNIAAFKLNQKLNKIKNITLINGALGEKSGNGVLSQEGDSHNHHLIPAESELPDTVRVPIFSLHDICLNLAVSVFSLIKMDIEGAEFDLLRAWDKTDFAKFYGIILEYHNTKERNQTELENILRENGFGVQTFPSKFDKSMGIIFANNKRLRR